MNSYTFWCGKKRIKRFHFNLKICLRGNKERERKCAFAKAEGRAISTSSSSGTLKKVWRSGKFVKLKNSISMEQPPFISQRRGEPEFSLREWAAKAKITRDPATSRRFSGSYIRSFREDARSFRSNITTITSTASSPGYPFGGFLFLFLFVEFDSRPWILLFFNSWGFCFVDEIDPATYSFTNAIKGEFIRNVFEKILWFCGCFS